MIVSSLWVSQSLAEGRRLLESPFRVCGSEVAAAKRSSLPSPALPCPLSPLGLPPTEGHGAKRGWTDGAGRLWHAIPQPPLPRPAGSVVPLQHAASFAAAPSGAEARTATCANAMEELNGIANCAGAHSSNSVLTSRDGAPLPAATLRWLGHHPFLRVKDPAAAVTLQALETKQGAHGDIRGARDGSETPPAHQPVPLLGKRVAGDVRLLESSNCLRPRLEHADPRPDGEDRASNSDTQTMSVGTGDEEVAASPDSADRVCTLALQHAQDRRRTEWTPPRGASEEPSPPSELRGKRAAQAAAGLRSARVARMNTAVAGPDTE